MAAESLWISFAFLTASIFATLNIFDKVVLDTDARDPTETLLASGFGTAVVFVALGIATGETGLGGTLSPGTLIAFTVGLLGGAFYILSLWTYFVGLEKADVSRFVPLMSLDVVLVLALGFVLLGEGFGPVVYGGITIVFLGTILISLEDVTEGIELASTTALVFAVLVAGAMAGFNVILKFLTAHLSLFGIMFWVGLGSMGTMAVFAAGESRSLVRSGGTATKAIVPSLKTQLLVVGGGVTGIAYITFTRALETGPVSLATAILKLDVFMVFFGVLVLSRMAPEVLYEEDTRAVLLQKFCAACLILLGVVVIQTFSG